MAPIAATITRGSIFRLEIALTCLNCWVKAGSQASGPAPWEGCQSLSGDQRQAPDITTLQHGILLCISLLRKSSSELDEEELHRLLRHGQLSFARRKTLRPWTRQTAGAGRGTGCSSIPTMTSKVQQASLSTDNDTLVTPGHNVLCVLWSRTF